jgi:hypothetical protein
MRRKADIWQTYRETTQNNVKNLKLMGDGILLCTYVQRSKPTSRWSTKLEFGKIMEGPTKPKGKIQKWENFTLRGSKLGMENAMSTILRPKCKSK